MKHRNIFGVHYFCDFEDCHETATHIVAMYSSDEYPYQYDVIVSCDEHIEAVRSLEPCEYWVTCPVCDTEFGV